MVPQGRAAVDAMVPPPPPAAKRGRKRKVPLEMSMALPPPPPPPPPRPLPVEETDADGTVTTTLDGGSILPLPKKRGRKPKNPPASISVGIEMPQNLIHVQQQLPSLSMREFNSPFVSVLPPLPPPPPPPDLSLLSKTHGLPNGHVHLPLMPNANGVVFGGAVPPPPPQFALVQALNGRFSSLPPPPPMHVDRFGDGGFGHGNASFLHHPVPPRRVP